MIKSESFASLAGSLVKAQAEWPKIPKSKTVTVRTAQSGTYEFKYAPLEELINQVRPVLAKHGLGFTQGIEADRLVTTIFHESGEWLSHSMPITENGHIQQYGSILTYKRRYSLKAALGIESDDDDEGAASMPEEKVKIKPNADPWSNVPKERHESLRRKASSVIDCFTVGMEKEAFKAYSEVTDNEEKLCVWSLLDSKMRATIKRLGKEQSAIST